MLIKFPFGLSLEKILVEVYLRFIIFLKNEKFKVKAENNLINPSKLKEVFHIFFKISFTLCLFIIMVNVHLQ